MTRNKRPSGPKLSARANLEGVVSAKYSRSHRTTEIIPPDVTRAKAGAWLTIISPLTEWAGLKGDELRHKRDILRLQREDVLARIASRARRRLASGQNVITPVPNKFLVPFLEQASLEEPDSSLVDLWANLLVSASTGFSSHHIHFVSVISRLSAKQGELFKAIFGTSDLDKAERAIDDISIWYQAQAIRSTLLDAIEKKGASCSDDEVADLIVHMLDRHAIAAVHSSFENMKTHDYFEVDLEGAKYSDDLEVDYSILEAIGLIKRVDTGFFNVDIWMVTMLYYHVTSLGFHFAKACGIIK